jgi:hypothetical protein
VKVKNIEDIRKQPLIEEKYLQATEKIRPQIPKIKPPVPK